MTLLEQLKQMGISDLSVLLPKTLRKLKDYDKLVKSPIARNKSTGELHPGTKQRLEDLAEDIITEATVYLKQQNRNQGPTAEEIETARKQKEEADAAEAKRKQEEEDAAEAQRKQEEESKKQKKGKGLADWLFED